MREMTPQEKADLKALDERLRIQFPKARLEEGCKYMRWAVLDDQFGASGSTFIEVMAKALKAHGWFHGKVCGKQQTIFFFMPWFD